MKQNYETFDLHQCHQRALGKFWGEVSVSVPVRRTPNLSLAVNWVTSSEERVNIARLSPFLLQGRRSSYSLISAQSALGPPLLKGGSSAAVFVNKHSKRIFTMLDAAPSGSAEQIEDHRWSAELPYEGFLGALIHADLSLQVRSQRESAGLPWRHIR